MPEPRLISAFETVAFVGMFESPPRSHARELAPAKAVHLAVGGDRREQVEEIEDDL